MVVVRLREKFSQVAISFGLVLLLIFSFPLNAVIVHAEGDGSSTTGPQSPTGADANTYIYNPSTGLWENAYYTWNPATNQTTPKTPRDYSYNPATGMWDTTQWKYDAPSGKYIPNVTSTATNPDAGTPSTISNTGPGSTNTVDSTSQNNGIFNNFYNASVSNKQTSQATSGDASVISNTSAGNATSGGATSITNVMNLLQSTWGVQPTVDMLTFTTNINGDVVGDLYLDPSRITNAGSLSTSSINTDNQNNLTVNSKGSGQIINDITLGATSGDTTVSKNTNAGNATTGNANAVANVVNVLNSAIAAGKSFLGVININGNLNGDILLPPNFLDQLITSGAPSSTVTLSQTKKNTLTANLNSNQTIDNTVDLTATSGEATVDHNTTGGNAASGDATTNLTIFNLTGRQVIGSNSLLVFVNVLGGWVGLIMDAPAGSNSAAYCGGTCQITSNTENNATINDTSDQSIINKLKLNAQSGNASVTDNTTGGNATTGDATSSANILNISSSQFALSNWLGILFINVFGDWRGSFGLNTDAGTVFRTALAGADSSGALPSTPASFQVFRFVPEDDGTNQLVFNAAGDSQTDQKGVVLSTQNNQNGPTAPTDQKAGATKGGLNWAIPVITFASLLIIFGGIGANEYMDRLRAHLISRKMNKGRHAWPKFTLF